MRLLKKVISGKPPSGFVDILPEDDEDLWHAYNLIAMGDSVTAGTFRKVCCLVRPHCDL
jgi:protein pelota